jgi:adenylate kinase
VIENLLRTPTLSTGEMLRAAAATGTLLGLQAKGVMAAGGLVDNMIVIGIIKERIANADCAKGFILDGFPRTIVQAKALDDLLESQGLHVTKVIELDVPDDELEERICGRWVHPGSGRSYHIRAAPPKSLQLDSSGNPVKESLKDDITSDLLVQRADDTKEALGKRLTSYHNDTKPILEHYRPRGVVMTVNANQSIHVIREEIEKALQHQE